MRSEILDYQAGRSASMAGQPRDGRRNVDWLRGWDDVFDDRRLDDDDDRQARRGGAQ
jgi:hypothetical protein